MEKILIVDDDAKICDIIKKYLIHEGYEVMLAFKGKQAKAYFEDESFSLIILDVMLPDTTGFNLLQSLRDSNYSKSSKSTDKETPVIMLTALGQTQNVIKGLKYGADDYVTKPFEPRELLERIKTILRRSHIHNHIKIEIGNTVIDFSAQTVKCNGIDLTLQRREMDLLLTLIKNRDKVLSRETLLNVVWGIDYIGSDRAVDICIQRLRTKLVRFNADIEIKTVWGTGYKLERKND